MEKSKAYLVIFMSVVFLIMFIDALIFARGVYLFWYGTDSTKMLIIALVVAFIDAILAAIIQVRAMYMMVADEE